MAAAYVNLEGRITGQPVKKEPKPGLFVTEFGVAVNDTTDGVSFFDVVAFGDAAEAVATHDKGARVFVAGHLKQERWEKDGKRHSRVRVFARHVSFAFPIAKKSQSTPEGAPS